MVGLFESHPAGSEAIVAVMSTARSPTTIAGEPGSGRRPSGQSTLSSGSVAERDRQAGGDLGVVGDELQVGPQGRAAGDRVEAFEEVRGDVAAADVGARLVEGPVDGRSR